MTSINISFTQNYDQRKPDLDMKYDEDQSQLEIRFDHAHPHKLEDFFNKGKKGTWKIDQSTLDKVQKLIKDIELYNNFTLKAEPYAGKLGKKQSKDLKEFADEFNSKNVQVLKKDITLLYNIYSYTNAAFSLPECNHRPLAKTIAELAFATLKVQKDESTKEVKKFIQTILNLPDTPTETEKAIKTVTHMINALNVDGSDSDS